MDFCDKISIGKVVGHDGTVYLYFKFVVSLKYIAFDRFLYERVLISKEEYDKLKELKNHAQD